MLAHKKYMYMYTVTNLTLTLREDRSVANWVGSVAYKSSLHASHVHSIMIHCHSGYLLMSWSKPLSFSQSFCVQHLLQCLFLITGIPHPVNTIFLYTCFMIHPSHIYVRSHRGGDTFSLSLHVIEICYEETSWIILSVAKVTRAVRAFQCLLRLHSLQCLLRLLRLHSSPLCLQKEHRRRRRAIANTIRLRQFFQVLF